MDDQRVTGGVVVGVDGSERSDAGLVWALHEAERRGAGLRVLHAYHPPIAYGYPYAVLSAFGAAVDGGAARAAAEAALARALRRTTSRPPSCTVEAVRGPAAAALTGAAHEADLVVVTRAHDALATRLLLGSVTTAVLHHADADVAVVPAGLPHPDRDPTRVVVGADGGEHSAAALRVAVLLAEQRGAVLQPVLVRPPMTGDRAALLDEPGLDLAAERTLGRDAVRLAAGAGLKVDPGVVTGSPGPVLVDIATEDDVLVVGARRSPGARGWLLGSTSRYVVTHAHAPVLVVR